MELSRPRRLRAAARSALKGLRATPLIFLASAGTMAAGLLLLGVYLLLLENMRSVLDQAGDELKLVAYLTREGVPTDGDLSRFLDKIGALEAVESVQYVSADEALARLRSALGKDASVVDGLKRNPLPASVEIQPRGGRRSAAAVQDLARQLRALRGVDEVRYGVEWVEGYTRILRGVEWIGVMLGAFLLLVLGAIVAATVRLALHARHDEIQIQRLVGANTLFVRLPFYLEGLAQGLVAALVAICVLWGLYALGLPLVGEPLRFVLGQAELRFLGAGELVLLAAVGVGLGVGGAALSLAHLDEGA
jgi:cell division transport system permease protein